MPFGRDRQLYCKYFEHVELSINACFAQIKSLRKKDEQKCHILAAIRILDGVSPANLVKKLTAAAESFVKGSRVHVFIKLPGVQVRDHV